MVMMYLSVSSYMCVISFYISIVCFVVLMIFSWLHSIIDIWMYGVIVSDGMNLGSLVCMGVIWVCINWLYWLCCCLV